MINNGRDATANLPAVRGQKTLHVGVRVEGVPASIQDFLLVDPQWRHPILIPFV
jgi:hypothetical protein